MLEKEEKMSKKNETKRKIPDKTKTGKGEEMHLRDGEYQMDGNGEEWMTGKACNYWCQKSPMMPRTPALGHTQHRGKVMDKIRQ